MFVHARDDASASQHRQFLRYVRAYDRYAAYAVRAAPGDDEHLVRAFNLLSTQPRISTRCRCRSAGQPIAQVERTRIAELSLVECLE